MRKKFTTEEFVLEARSKYGDERYLYQKTVYAGCNKDVVITCVKHGDFSQRTDKHLLGYEGCRDCRKEILSKTGKWSNERILGDIRSIAKDGIASSLDGGMSLCTMARRRFGSWDNACKIAGIKSISDKPIYDGCCIDGCANSVRSPHCKWCEMHYYRNRRNGDPEKLFLCQYSVDEHIFNEWNDANAWLLGLLWTDGWMGRANSVGIKLKDVQLIETVKSVMNTDVKIKTAYTKGKEYKYFSIASKFLADRLRDIGMHSNKTLTIQYPQELPNEFFWAFLRGVIDGDGTVWLKKRGNAKDKECRVSFVTASPEFAKQMRIQLQNRNIVCSLSVRRRFLKNGGENKSYGKHDLYKIQVCKQSCIRILYEQMFSNANVPCLHRKRDFLTEFYNTPRSKPGRPCKKNNN